MNLKKDALTNLIIQNGDIITVPETSHLPVVQSQVISLPDDSCLSNPANQVNVVNEHSPLGVC